ncbi:MAG: hypothetical protein KAS66_03545 [Candidatus Omnitrophica bacterium]|nr:hypothetical protein [Candidatus Omnitrophota bacterium]
MIKNIPDDETVPCKFCGETTIYTATELCNNCWEFEHRIDQFISNENGLNFVVKRIKALKIRAWQDKWLKEIDERFSNGELETFPLYTDSILTSIDDNISLEVWVKDMEKLRNDPLASEIIDDAISNNFLWLEV